MRMTITESPNRLLRPLPLPLLTKIGSSKSWNSTASTLTTGLPFVRFIIMTSIFKMSLFTSCSIFWNIIFCADKTIQCQLHITILRLDRTSERRINEIIIKPGFNSLACDLCTALLDAAATLFTLGLAVAAAETVAIIRSLRTINAQQMVKLNKIVLNPNPYMLFYQFRTFRELNLIKLSSM